MGDYVDCEHCGKPGRRITHRPAPEGWWFGAFTFPDDGDHDPGDRLIVVACSEECRNALWTKQDGHRWSEIERRIDVPAEIRRYAGLVAGRLRDEARRIREGTDSGDPDASAWAGMKVAALLDSAAEELQDEAEREVEAMAPATPTGGA